MSDGADGPYSPLIGLHSSGRIESSAETGKERKNSLSTLDDSQALQARKIRVYAKIPPSLFPENVSGRLLLRSIVPWSGKTVNFRLTLISHFSPGPLFFLGLVMHFHTVYLNWTSSGGGPVQLPRLSFFWIARKFHFPFQPCYFFQHFFSEFFLFFKKILIFFQFFCSNFFSVFFFFLHFFFKFFSTCFFFNPIAVFRFFSHKNFANFCFFIDLNSKRDPFLQPGLIFLINHVHF